MSYLVFSLVQSEYEFVIIVHPYYVEVHGIEYTFCCDRGILRHQPRNCDWGLFLGSVRLGEVSCDWLKPDQLAPPGILGPGRVARASGYYGEGGFLKY